MREKQYYITQLKQFKQECAQRFGIRSIGIFGSVARGEQRPNSDLDVFVDLSDPDYFLLCDIKESLESRCGCHVDLVRMRDNMQPVLRQNIMRDGIYA